MKVNQEYSIGNVDDETIATNHLIGEDILIRFYLSGKKFRKNVSHLRIARFINHIFLCEFICALGQKETNTHFTKFCDNPSGHHCKCSKTLSKMNILM